MHRSLITAVARRSHAALLRSAAAQSASPLAALGARAVSTSPLLRKEEDRVAEAKANLASGNVQEAYGLSDDAGALGKANVLQKYGVLPVVGFGLAAAISKEWLILNEEILVAFCFGSFATSAYVALGDDVAKGLDAESAEIQKEAEGVFDELAGAVKTHIEAHRANASVAEDAAALVDHYYTLLGDLEGAYYRKLRQETAGVFNERLGYLQQLERKTLTAYATNISDSSESFVRDAYVNAPQELKDRIVESALASLSGKKSKSGADPMAELYAKYFQHVRKLAADLEANPRPVPADVLEQTRESLEREKNKIAALGVDVSGLDTEPASHYSRPHPQVPISQ
jgi:uncharacterized protein YjbJ (UPF0337 family)